MFALIKLYFLFNLHYIVIECLIPGISSELNVRTLDQKVINRKRQDTMDMCRIFTEETEKLEKLNGVTTYTTETNNLSAHRRAKRALPQKVINPMLTMDDAQRVENIVDKLYDDLLEKGEKINYRRVDVKTLEKTGDISTNISEPGRRFNFAPQTMTDDTKSEETKWSDKNFDPLPPSISARFELGIIPYFIDRQSYDSHLDDIIVKAFDYFEKVTCIRLQRLHERPTDRKSLQDIQWLYITNPTGIRKCVHSNEKVLVKGVQMVVLGYDCMSQGDIIHEIMHVLGFSHEHCRPDRDKYISIMWDNIKPGYKKYFFRNNTYAAIGNLPYDYASVMHYPPRAFSKNGRVTIMTQPGIKIGQREALSEIDVQKINMVYSAECVKRNREYLATTCPSVVRDIRETKKPTKEEIEDYYRDRLWKYGIVNYRLRDPMDFTHDEKENLLAVIRHIETETCIEFRDLTSNFDDNKGGNGKSNNTIHTKIKENINISDEVNNQMKDNNDNISKNDTSNDSVDVDEDGEVKEANEVVSDSSSSSDPEVADNEIKSDDNLDKPSENERNGIMDDDGVPMRSSKRFIRRKKSIRVKVLKSKMKNESPKTSNPSTSRKNKRVGPISPSRRHAINILEFTRSPLPGCPCPRTSGIPSDNDIIEIHADCFNSVNILLHLFVHILGLEHQHNSHDRDSFIHVIWNNLTDDIKSEMQHKLPAAASAGLDYDYQSVMHYPWLQIKNGQSNIMYPIWNDGWAMGNWQGLSSVDVQKINLLYSKQCTLRRQEVEAVEIKLRTLATK